MTKVVIAVAVGGLALAAPAHAELVFFRTGRVMSVKSHRLDGAMLVITTRTGGEVSCDPALIDRIEPDEVPYPAPSELARSSAGGVGGANAETASPGGAVDQLVENSRYEPMIERASARHGVDPTLVRAVIQVESAYHQRARSAKGAMGLMQLMPAVARQYAVRDPYDPAANIDAGTRHLKSLLDRFPLSLALAAYNAGEAAVERFGGVPPYPETRNYVARILNLIR